MSQLRPFSVRLSVMSTLLLGSAIALTGCKTAPGYTPAEAEVRQTLSPSNYQSRTQEERDAIETQDLFTQAAFWSREYDLNPADLEAAVKLSSVLRRMGNPAQALEIITTSRAMYPRDVALVSELGANLIALERGREAIAPLSGALRMAPGNARLWSLTGAAHDQIGEFKQAREYYTRALNLAPNDANIVGNVGLSFALEGDPATAETWLRRAAAMPGASANVRQNLALVLGIQGKYEEAERLARQDLQPEAVEQNMDYMRSLRGSSRSYGALAQDSAPTQAQSTPQPQYRAPTASSAQPRTYGTYQPQTAPTQSYAQSAPQQQPQLRTAPSQQAMRAPARQQPAQQYTYGGYPVQNGAPAQTRAPQPAQTQQAAPPQFGQVPTGRQNVVITGEQGSSRDALMAAQQARTGAAPQQQAYGTPQQQQQQHAYGAPQQAATGQPNILGRIAQSVQPGTRQAQVKQPQQSPGVQITTYPGAPAQAQNYYPQQGGAYQQPQAQPGYGGYPQPRRRRD